MHRSHHLSRQRRSAAVALGCAVVLLAGCGTTADLSQLQGVQGGANDGLDTPPGATAPALSPSVRASAVGPSSVGPSSGDGQRATTPASQASTSKPTNGSDGQTATPAPSGKATGSPVQLGVPYDADITSIYATLGITSASLPPAEFQARTKAILAYVNAHGGISGHPAVPVFYGYNPDSGTFSSQMQAMCNFFTEDDHVLAVVSDSADIFDPLPECLAAHHTLLVDDGVNSQTYALSQVTSWAPYYSRPFQIDLSRIGVEAEGLIQAGFVHKGDRIGVLRIDSAAGSQAEDATKEALARHGMSVTADFAYTLPQSLGDAATFESESLEAVLRFRSAGVTQVIILGGSTYVADGFSSIANVQGYHPYFGLSSFDVPGFEPGNAPAGQVARMTAVGWNRRQDIDFNGATISATKLPAYRRCQAIERQGHATTTNGGYMCDAWLVMQHAFAGQPLTAAGYQAGLVALGSSFQPAAASGVDFQPGRVGGITIAHVTRYDSKCSCFQYVGKPIPVP
jgi:hypothetical protein